MSVGTLVYVYTYALNSLMLTSATAGWLSSLIGCAIWIGFVLVASYAIKKSGHDNLAALVYDCLGEFFGMVVNCLIAVAVILSMSERLFECIRLMKLYGYNYTPAVIIAAVIMLVAFYCGKAGHKAVAKTAIPVLFGLLIGIVIVILSGLRQYDLGNLFPILGYGTKATVKGSLWTLSSVDNILIGLIIADKIGTRDFKNASICASVTALIAYVISCVCYSLAFPYSATLNNTSGIIDIARGTESGGFFQRFEAILLFIVIIGMICFVSIYLSAAVKQIDETFSVKKKRSAWLSATLSVIVAILALIPDNTKTNDQNLLQIYRRYSFVFVFAIGIVLLIGGIIKHNLYKKLACAALILGLTFTACSCGDYREVENEAYAVMIGIDKGETEKGHTYSIRMMNEKSNIITSTGQSLGSVINDVSQTSSRKLSLKNLRILAISSELANDGISQFIEPIVEDTGTKNSIMLAICSESAEKFISFKRFDDMQEIELTVDNTQQSNMYEPRSISSVYNSIHSSGKDASAPYVINGKDKDEEDKISGTALFVGEKLAGVIDGDETAVIKAVSGTLKDYPIPLDGYEYLISSQKAAKIKVDGSNIEVNVFLKCTHGGESTDKLPDNVREVITKRLNEVMTDLTQSGSDILGFGRVAAKDYNTITEFENSGWKQKFKAVNIKTKLVI